MENLSKQELKTKIAELENKIVIRTGEFVGEVGYFQHFLKQAITKQLHAYTLDEYQFQKPSFEQFEDILFNIDMLNEILLFMSEIQSLDSKLQK